MPSNQAKVTSSEALDFFRASLIIFQSKARRSLDDAADELRRTRMWLQHDQRVRWENELKKCRQVLARAEQDLLSAKLSGLRDNITFQLNAVRKAKAALEHAEVKQRQVKKWNQTFDAVADPLGKRLEGLRQYLDFNLPKGIAFLVQAARIIEEYAATPMTSGPATSGASTAEPGTAPATAAASASPTEPTAAIAEATAEPAATFAEEPATTPEAPTS